MHPIRKERFEALVGYSRLPHAKIISRELEWYASVDEILLATILVDFEEEFVAIILGRDEDQKFRAIEALTGYKNINNARLAMQNKADDLIKQQKTIFFQGDEKGNKRDLFDPMYGKAKLNPNFEKLRTSKGYSSAKEILAEAMHHYTDVDGNFIEQFQTTGFDSRLWEFYLFAYLTEENLYIDRTHQAPDFLVSNGKQNVAIEAVTVQSSKNSEELNLDITALTPEKIAELQRHYMPIKFGSPLFTKLNKKYWEMPHVAKNPLVFAIADFHAKQSMLWSSTALQNYLYGIRHDFYYSEDGRLVISPIKIDYHEHNGKKIHQGSFSLKILNI